MFIFLLLDKKCSDQQVTFLDEYGGQDNLIF